MCAHKQLTIFKLYEPPENGARRRPCEAHMGHTPVLSRLTAGISPARHNMEFLSVFGGRTPKNHKVAGGRDFNRHVLIPPWRDHDGGVFVLGVGGFPLHIKLHSNMRNASRHVVV